MLNTQANYHHRHILSKNECKILFILENSDKPLTITQLAKHAGIQRGTVYANIKKLQQRSLVFVYGKKYSCSLWQQQEYTWWKVAEALYEARKRGAWIMRVITPTRVIIEKPRKINTYIYDIHTLAQEDKRPIVQFLCGNTYIIHNRATSSTAVFNDPALAQHIRKQWTPFLVSRKVFKKIEQPEVQRSEC